MLDSTDIKKCLLWSRNNIAAELPLLGRFATGSLGQGCYSLTRQLVVNAFMFGGMVGVMAYKMPKMDMKDNLLDSGIMLGEMHAFMFVGAVSFNIVMSAADSLVRYCSILDETQEYRAIVSPREPENESELALSGNRLLSP